MRKQIESVRKQQIGECASDGMRVLVTWSSVTGNTEKIARAVARKCPHAEIVPVADAPDPGGFDTIFLAFWCDKGQIDERSRAYLETIREAARKKGSFIDVAFFGTMGGDPRSERSIAWRDRVIDAEVGDGTLIRCIGRRMWQGRVDPEVTERMNRVIPMTPERRALLEEAARHPNEEDEQEAEAWAAAILDSRLPSV